MASSKLVVIISALLVVALAFPLAMAGEYTPTKRTEKDVEVIVEGMVYCQSCDKFGSWSLTGAKPLPSAKVSVICKDQKNRVSYYKVFATDSAGHFYAELKEFNMGQYILEHPLHACKVKLVSSPVESCNLLSNVNNALYGSPLRFEDKELVGKNYKAVIYSAGPLAFRPAHCAP